MPSPTSPVSAATAFPLPGWLDSHAAAAGSVALYTAGLPRHIVAGRGLRLDWGPADVVAQVCVDALVPDPQHHSRMPLPDWRVASRRMVPPQPGSHLP